MSRLPALDRDALSAEARAVYDHIAGEHDHGQVRGPWPIELRVPEAAQAYHDLYKRLCTRPKIGKRLFELMVLVVARHWNAQFEWFAHERQARAAGVAPEVCDAIRERRIPPFARDDERLVYEIIGEINETRTLGQAAYDRGLAAFGEEQFVELILGAGTYASIAMQLNVFDIRIPPDARPLA